MSWMDSLNAATRGAKKDLPPKERDRICSDVVMMCSLGSAAVTYAPIPLTDFILVTPIQASMVMAVGRVYGRELNLEESKHILIELASVCGLSLLAQKGFATLTKLLLPGLGGVLAGPYAFAVTYGMGRVAMRYFRDKEHSRETLKKAFNDALREGRRIFSREKVEDFREKKGREVSDFAKRNSGEPRSAPSGRKKPGRRSGSRRSAAPSRAARARGARALL